MDRLRVRAYNVRFGDAILVSVPDRDPATGDVTPRHILIDVGNVLAGEGGLDDVFQPVIDDVVEQLEGRPLDLYVMTHEHMDHVQGLLHAATKIYPDGELAEKMPVDFAWLSASAEEGYYDRFPDARRKKLQLLAAYDEIERYLAASPESVAEPWRTLLLNNNPRKTADCVEFLRELAGEDGTTYVHRGIDLTDAHPFREATFEIWAPEEDTSDYYGSFSPMHLGLMPGPAGAGPVATRPLPPPGVDAGAFYELIEMRRSGIADNLLAIDKAANNSSVVFSLAWRGWTLLFPGDAEIRSWLTMEREGVLRPVHFLKVSHHGSHNGTPEAELFDAILPEVAPDDRPRRALISTWNDTYSGIPHDPTNERLADRCELVSILDEPQLAWIDVEFEGE